MKTLIEWDVNLKFVNLLKSSVIIGTIVMTLLTSTIDAVKASVFAGGRPRHDYDERYEDVLGASECWTDGFDDGVNDSFDNEEYKGDQYSRGFKAGSESCTDENIERNSSVEKDCIDARKAAT